MGIIGTIFIGLIVGLLARFLKPGDDSMGWIMTILLGIGGSLAATYGGQALGIYQAGEGAGFLGALVGAVVLLVMLLAYRSAAVHIFPSTCEGSAKATYEAAACGLPQITTRESGDVVQDGRPAQPQVAAGKLHSYANPDHEIRIRDRLATELPETVFITAAT